MSGKGAHPFQSAWLESAGETPGRVVENLLLAGRVDDKTDTELRALCVVERQRFTERLETGRSTVAQLQAEQHAAFSADPALVALLEAVAVAPLPNVNETAQENARREQAISDALVAYGDARAAHPIVGPLDRAVGAAFAARAPGAGESALLAAVREQKRRGVAP